MLPTSLQGAVSAAVSQHPVLLTHRNYCETRRKKKINKLQLLHSIPEIFQEFTATTELVHIDLPTSLWWCISFGSTPPKHLHSPLSVCAECQSYAGPGRGEKSLSSLVNHS